MTTGANRDRLRALAAQLEQLRGPSVAPSQPPPPMAPGRAQPTLAVLVDMAAHHVALGELDAARLALGEAAPLFHEVNDAPSLARASLLAGEVLIAIDSPRHARERLEAAVSLHEQVGDTRGAARARMGLGRALVLLEEPSGIDAIEQARQAFVELGDTNAVAQADAALDDARRGADAHGRIRVGYGRMVSMLPAPLK